MSRILVKKIINRRGQTSASRKYQSIKTYNGDTEAAATTHNKLPHNTSIYKAKLKIPSTLNENSNSRGGLRVATNSLLKFSPAIKTII
jgi:hypothetical protein